MPFLLEEREFRIISPLLWSLNSPDLNPVDYSVWDILQEKVYKRRVTDLDDLKHRIRTEWTKLDHAVTAAAVHQWRRRLSVSVKAGDGHFEHCFDFDIVFAAITATFLAVVDQSNSCTLGRFGSIAVVSYDFVLCNRHTWRLFNSQGKVAILIR